MAIIRQLSPHIADLIAAGEVVERPMSVVKELLENSIDAGASDITVEIENGGISYIRVADNGCGMSPDDAKISFLRHATSKVFTEQDLDGISTLGFRGEALAAISAVSKIDLFTKRKDDSTATLVSVSSGEILSVGEVGAADGTTFVIRDLFFNTPARMKFLKKDYTEAGYITSVVQNIALSHPEIAIKYIKDNKILLKTSGNGDLKSVIYSVLGKEPTADLMELTPYDNDGIIVKGFVSKPHCAKATRGLQHFFVNGRLVKSRLIMSALEQAYKNVMMTGKFPYGVINISVPETKVDVNVHPTKTEVKFDNEKSIFNCIYMACKNTITEQNMIVQKTDIKPVIRDENPVFVQQEIEYKKPIFSDISNAFTQAKEQEKISIEHNVENSNREVSSQAVEIIKPMDVVSEMLMASSEYVVSDKPVKQNNFTQSYDENSCERESFAQVDNAAYEPVKESISNPLKVVGECFNTYILCEFDNEFIIIDKHAAHERINFNKLLENKSNIPSQVLLKPEIIDFNAVEFTNIIENIDEINKIGFNIEQFSEKSIVVREIPAILDREDISDIFHDIASKLSQNKAVEANQIDDILHHIACKASIKGNMYTSAYELEKLARRVLFDNEINYCPHGRPVKIALSKREIEKMFKRIL